MQQACALRPTARPTRQAWAQRRAGTVVGAAGRGFGSGPTKQPKHEDEERLVEGQAGPRRLKSKGKKLARAPQPPQPQPMAPVTAEAAESLVEQLEFNKRLAALKQEAEQKKAELAAQKSGPSLLDSAKAAELYDNPPPLSATLLGGGEAAQDKSLAEYESGAFGPSQAGLAAAAVILGAIFIIASGGSDLGYASRQAARPPAEAVELPPAQREELEGRLAKLQERLGSEGEEDLEALEGAAVLNAQLGHYEAARQQLQRLTSARPDDAEAWRVLAETQGALGERGAAVDAYRRAWVASEQGSLEVLTGLTGALVADGKEAEAVDLVRAARDAGGAGLGSTEVELLLGRTYAQWRGHVSDALSTYDNLIQASPEDFRPYLAKGLLLRQEGRLGDAQRFFLQAKYHAPPESRPTVEAVIAAGA